ncbi:MAG: hypothetical protein HYU54_04205 [Actinobacteria bacterium]|nr:hypothetical protein [Actinomycetota bacterium]
MQCPYLAAHPRNPDAREPRGFSREPHPRMTRREFLTRSAMTVAGATLFSCTGGRPIPNVTDRVPGIDTRWPIKRVVYLMLENRSFDHIFGKYPGANGTTVGVDYGREIPLKPAPQWLPGDLPHDRAAHLNNVNGGEMDGFAQGIYGPEWAFTQFDRQDLPNYFAWADEYVLCDNFFASAGGPSYPNHFFFVAGQSGGTLDNPENIEVAWEDGKKTKSWGCDAYGDDVFVFVKDDHGNLTKHDTCFDFRTVPQQLSEIGVDWAYYSASRYQTGYFWNALNGIASVFHTDMWHEHVRPVDRLVEDVAANRLPAVTWITPRFELSDHPPFSSCYSHNWVTGIVNALMASEMWTHTALFVTWDEWGGLYDHVLPPRVDEVGLGIRVPMLVISPYAKRGYIDDALGEFSTPLKFIADNWGLPYLTSRIADGHNFEHVFDFERNPRQDARPLPALDACYGKPFEFPDSYPGWDGTEPTENPI